MRVTRYRCTHDGYVREVFAHDTSRLARPGASTTRRCAQYILRRLAIDRASGVDEHKWSHVLGRRADGFVTVITDLTSVVAGKGPVRLLDMVPDHSAAAMSSWLEARTKAFRDQVWIVATDGYGGCKNAATKTLPDVVTVMDPFHVVALAGHKTLKPEEPTILVSKKLGGSILVSAKRWSGCLNYPLGA
ncbi:transposase [Streptomyces antimycoticus]|uniref:transposase n=1 Tax=Streptomyces antimycoticus TaxID=68175 RepID=UPI003F4DB23F